MPSGKPLAGHRWRMREIAEVLGEANTADTDTNITWKRYLVRLACGHVTRAYTMMGTTRCYACGRYDDTAI